METMGLYRTDKGWMCRCKSNKPLFGTTDIPCAFTASAEPDFVLRKIKALNPDCNVVLIHG